MTIGKSSEQVTLYVETATGCSGDVTKTINRYYSLWLISLKQW
ncbi:MAG: hypothetical protein R2771_15840 [Saprospiraceae bacterium]